MAITYTETIMMDDFPSDGADMYYTFTVPNNGDILTAEVELFIGGDLASSTEYGRAYIDEVQIGGDLNGNNADSATMTSEGIFNIFTHLSGKTSVELHGYSSTATDVGFDFPDTAIKLEWQFTITYEEPSTSSGLNLHYKINSEYKNIINSYTKVSGDWKSVVAGFTKINGEWLSLGSAYIAPPGQAEWTTPGTYSWVVPEGITSISAVAVGGGGASGSSGSNYSGGGGGGGGLAWRTITVTPFETLTVVVGAAGENPSGDGGGSLVKRVYASILSATGGKGGSSTHSSGVVTGTGGTAMVGDGGGAGGTGGQTGSNTAGGGGGGAAGYTGNGGNGGYGNSGTQATAGTGGGGGGGNPDGSSGAYGGGGVGIYGQGANGAVNSGGSGGGNPSIASTSGQITGGLFGGGGGAEEDDTTITGTKGGSGAVRIIWGEGRAYPSTNTADV